jgi:hypothetical protein
MNQKDLIKLAQTLKLDQWFLNQLNNPGSPAGRFYTGLVFNFILRELDEEPKTRFLRLINQGRGEAALELAQAEIDDFEAKLSAVTAQKLTQMKKQVIKQ